MFTPMCWVGRVSPKLITSFEFLHEALEVVVELQQKRVVGVQLLHLHARREEVLRDHVQVCNLRPFVGRRVEHDALRVLRELLALLVVGVLGVDEHLLDDEASHAVPDEDGGPLADPGILELLEHVLRPLLEALVLKGLGGAGASPLAEVAVKVATNHPHMVAVLSQPVPRPAEGVIFLAHLVITELMTVGCVLLAPCVENAAKQAVDENYIHPPVAEVVLVLHVSVIGEEEVDSWFVDVLSKLLVHVAQCFCCWQAHQEVWSKPSIWLSSSSRIL